MSSAKVRVASTGPTGPALRNEVLVAGDLQWRTTAPASGLTPPRIPAAPRWAGTGDAQPARPGVGQRAGPRRMPVPRVGGPTGASSPWALPFRPMHKGSREPSARTMAANYRVTHQPGNGQHFTRVATNGQVIATSQHYETHRSRLEGIESVRKNATTAEVEDGSAQ